MGGSLFRLWLLTAGVATGALVSSSGANPFAVFSLVISLAAVRVRRRPLVILAALFFFGLGSGLLAGSVRDDGGDTLAAVAKEVPFCEATGRLLEEVGGLGTLAALDRLTCEGNLYLRPGIVALESSAPAGSPFWASGWILPLGTDRFDVARAHAGADAELAPEEFGAGPPTGLAAVAASVREGLRAAGEELAPGPAGLIRGLTIGDTEGLSQVTIERFRRSGLSHLLAVSGSNVAIVLGGMAILLARRSFRTRIMLGAAALGLFVLVVGPDASVLRAAAMGGVGLFAVATGRQAEPLHALAVALTVVLLLRPQIVFSVGLHLSVAATAGIVLWAPRIERRTRLPLTLGVPLAVTLSAQAAVLPLLVGVFGQASIVAPVTNLLAAAAVPPATVLGLLGALAGTAHPWLGGLVLRLAAPFAEWILLVGRMGAEPTWAMLELPHWWGLGVAVPVCLCAARTLATYGAPISLER